MTDQKAPDRAPLLSDAVIVDAETPKDKPPLPQTVVDRKMFGRGMRSARHFYEDLITRGELVVPKKVKLSEIRMEKTYQHMPCCGDIIDLVEHSELVEGDYCHCGARIVNE